MSVFSERVKKLRKDKKQSQNEVGKALGKSRETISKYELGEREPDPNVIALLAKHFNVSSDYMLGITDESEINIIEISKKASPELHDFESYFKSEKIIPYLRLAIIMLESKIDVNEFKVIINNYIDQISQQKHLKK